VVVLGGHVSAAIVATDSSVADPDADATSRLWSAVVTHNRELVIRMARPMLERLTSLRHTPSETLRRLTSAQTSSRFPTA
jgi:hypothetical protein